MPDYNKYQISISDELTSIKDRVRNFIKHWPEDGRYKEEILKDIIANRLPSFAKCGTGFVINNYNEVTSQIDIIIYNCEIPLLFKKGNFVIVPSDGVLGIIEVKSNIRKQNLDEIMMKSHRNGEIIGNQIFNGIFAYDCDFREALNNRKVSIFKELESIFKNYNGRVNNISFGEDYFAKFWCSGKPNNEQGEKYRLYELISLSFGYFISNLIEDVYISSNKKEIPNVLRNMFYPIEETKEAHKIHTIEIQ